MRVQCFSMLGSRESPTTRCLYGGLATLEPWASPALWFQTVAGKSLGNTSSLLTVWRQSSRSPLQPVGTALPSSPLPPRTSPRCGAWVSTETHSWDSNAPNKTAIRAMTMCWSPLRCLSPWPGPSRPGWCRWHVVVPIPWCSPTQRECSVWETMPMASVGGRWLKMKSTVSLRCSASHIIHKMEGFDSPVTQAVCGQDHSLFLTETGKVYACGWGADGQTGLGHHNMCAMPVAVGGDLAGVRVQQVTTYGDCSMAVSQDGQLYGWGNSEYLQLSSVTEATQINSPRLLPFEGVGKVTQVACGGTQVAILNERGEVFVWGYGILGKGPNLSESQTPELVPPTLFGRSEFNPAVTVSRIHCGLNHFAAVTDRGELFVWGKNVRGCLGIGKKEDQYFPWRVTVPGHVVDVACGVDHMVALVKSVI
ncbi:RCC1-like G exchanging factor-like protein isoform X2 [Salvelinus fontinalis]|uniref:RCC1-like G exchanging factor-like protein isoform X2 n=1 Tax=Salvelinus fontinalis TaxID=8038 RepID=UPI002485A19F|nr:RCC1-like G exchanging factor-like protein isoform X2 [Salvelinus fontinalis]